MIAALAGLVATGTSLAFVGVVFLQLVFIHSVATIGAARRCFVGAFALSGTVFAAVIFGLTGLLERGAAEVLLPRLITAQLVAAVGILPWMTVRSFAQHWLGDGKTASIAALVVIVGVWGAAAVFLTPCVRLDDVSIITEAAPALCTTLVDAILARGAFIGTCFVGILSGFAIVATPASYLLPVLQWKAVATAEKRVADLVSRQQHVLAMWSSRRRSLASLEATAAKEGQREAGGFFSRVRSAATAAWDGGSRTEHLKVECDGYGQVSMGLFLAMQEADELRQTARTARSWRGVLFVLYGVILSVYCVLKLFITAVNLALGRFSAKDPVTRTIELVSTVMTDAAWLGEWLGSAAFVFNAAIILAAIRGFLILVFRLTAHNRAVTAETSLYVFSAFMALYFLGLTVLMRLSLPTESRALLVGAIGSVPFRHYHFWNDVVMLITAGVTLVVKRSLDVVDTSGD